MTPRRNTIQYLSIMSIICMNISTSRPIALAWRSAAVRAAPTRRLPGFIKISCSWARSISLWNMKTKSTKHKFSTDSAVEKIPEPLNSRTNNNFSIGLWWLAKWTCQVWSITRTFQWITPCRSSSIRTLLKAGSFPRITNVSSAKSISWQWCFTSEASSHKIKVWLKLKMPSFWKNSKWTLMVTIVSSLQPYHLFAAQL